MEIQRQLLNFILGCEEDFSRPPTFLEIREQFPSVRPSRVTACLKSLEKRGLLTLGKGGQRILRTQPRVRLLPPIHVQGSIAAGFSGAGVTNALRGSIAMDLSGIGVALRSDAFALQVSGDSMVDAGIRAGDLVLLEPGYPIDGEIVAASIKGQMILKRFVIVKKVPYLVAENAAQPDLRPATDEPIHGVLRALLRIAPTARAWKKPAPPKIRYSTELKGKRRTAAGSRLKIARAK